MSIKLSVGTDTFTPYELEPGAYYTITSDRDLFYAVNATPSAAQDENTCSLLYAPQVGQVHPSMTEFQFAAIGGAADSPATALALDDPAAQIVTLEKFTPEPPVGYGP